MFGAGSLSRLAAGAAGAALAVPGNEGGAVVPEPSGRCADIAVFEAGLELGDGCSWCGDTSADLDNRTFRA